MVYDLFEGRGGSFGRGWTRLQLITSSYFTAGFMCVWPKLRKMTKQELLKKGFKEVTIEITLKIQ